MAPTPVYLAGPITTVDEAIERMNEIDAYINANEPARDKDGVGCFNHLYGVITRRVREGIANGFFQDAEFLTQLDVAFANRYLDALRFSCQDMAKTPKAWKVLIERRGDAHIDPLQFAVAGVNAHINVDLAVAMLITCTKLHRKPDFGTQHQDYLKVNQIFSEEMRTLRQYYEDQAERRIDNAAAPVLDLAGNFAVEKARDAAWEVSEQLVFLQSLGVSTDGYIRHIDSLVALAGHMILTSVGD
jgi:hypothetical protein